MTDKTVTKVVEQEETVTVCDDCHREVTHDDGPVKLDLCDGCRDEFDRPIPPETVLTVDEWESAPRTHTFTPKSEVELLFGLAFGLGLLMAATTIALAVGVGWAAIGFSVVGVLFAIGLMMQAGSVKSAYRAAKQDRGSS